MREFIATNSGVTLCGQIDGPDDPSAPTVVFANSLGSSIALWEALIPLMSPKLRIIRYDLRGHGASDVPVAPYTMGQMVSDAAAVCDAAKVKDALFVGLSVGGLIAQGLAVKRPDLIRALVLSNTAAKIGNPTFWSNRIDAVGRLGMPSLADEIMPRWFGRDYYGSPDMLQWRDMLGQIDPQGYAGVCAAIAGTDFYTPTSGLRIPALGIAGGEDKTTPADMVRETVDLIPGSQFAVMPRCGHLPCVEGPIRYAEILSEFIDATGHL
ncbi:MAG: 3-oxoadipate enol-lactonase [Yoonia sp.]